VAFKQHHCKVLNELVEDFFINLFVIHSLKRQNESNILWEMGRNMANGNMVKWEYGKWEYGEMGIW
jgi:hypothetical protein